MSLEGTTLVAWYAAVVSTFACCVSLYVARRDRAKIAFHLFRNLQALDKNHNAISGESLIGVRIFNRGRRPLRIANVFLEAYYANQWAICTYSFKADLVLTEENPVLDCEISHGIIDPNSLYRVIVEDSAGRRHMRQVHWYGWFLKRYARLLVSVGLKSVDPRGQLR